MVTPEAGVPAGLTQRQLATRIISALSEQGQTLAVAESLTGGLLAAAIVEIPGASAVLRGGVLAYATEVKHQVLGVGRTLLAERGAVDPDVAAQMARGVQVVMGADWGLSTTGVAGPGPQDGVPAGRAFVGLAGPGVAGSSGVMRLDLGGDRAAVRAECVRSALEHLTFALSTFALSAASGPGMTEQGGLTGR